MKDGFRQSMAWLHTWTGLVVGWVLYFVFVTGTAGYFHHEITRWMQPERPLVQSQALGLDESGVAVEHALTRLEQLAPVAASWRITLPQLAPASRTWQELAIRWEDMPQPGHDWGATGNEQLNAQTGAVLPAEAEPRATSGGRGLYRMHYVLHYMSFDWGIRIVGVCTMLMLLAMVTGVIAHKKIFTDFFTFRWGKGQRSWLDAHNALSVFGLPFHLMITYTGLVTLMALYMPWGEQAAYKTPAQRQELTAELSAFIQPAKAMGQAAPLAPIDAMVRQGQARWGQYNVGRVTITNPGDASARVSVTRGDAARASMSPQYLLFDGTSGELLQAKDSVGPAAETRGVMYALHLGRFGDLPMRWLYFIVSLAGTAMVGTGLVMWTVKRRQKLGDPARPHFGFRLVEKLNIASIAGLSVAMAGFLWGNRLLPLEMAGRTAWEVHVFFAFWALALLHALLRPARRAWVEQFWAAAALLALLPLASAFLTDRPLWRSLAEGDWVFAGFELMLWLLAGLHVWLAVRTSRHQPPRRKASQAGTRAALPAGVALAEERVR